MTNATAKRFPCPACGSTSTKAVQQVDQFQNHRCRDCQSEFLWPQATDAELAEIYSSGYYDSWSGDSPAALRVKEATFRHILNWKPLRDIQSPLLDCGAGLGHFAGLCKKRGMDVYAIELNPTAIDAIGERIGRENVIEGLFDNVPDEALRKTQPSTISMLDFIEHVRSPRVTLEKAFRHLKPGGRIILTTPCVSSISRTIMRRHWFHYKPEHLLYFSRKGVTRLLKETGFENVQVRTLSKRMNLEYGTSQLAAHPIPLLTPAIRLIAWLCPKPLRATTFPVLIGEIIITGTKP